MSLEKCIFCGSQLTGDVCKWCGFSAVGKQQLSGTLPYGTSVNGYITGDVADMDGESTTYYAYDNATQTKVLLKEFLPVSMVAQRNGNTVTVQQGKEVLFKNLMMDFTDLYTSLSAIDSKNLQKIITIFSTNGTVYVVMEMLKGDTLRQNLIKRGKPYSFKEARWLFEELFDLLAVLEKNNIAHGGISDETVVITPDNAIVLTGFAIRDLRVKNEHIVYKLYEGFSAPEQYSLNRFSGFYTDIYSVSALLYHIVTGRDFSPEMLELKDTGRYMPKYAVETLKHATKQNPQDRIDNIEDFVLMLDNKATIRKSEKKQDKTTESTDLNKKLSAVIIGLILVLFAIGLTSMSGEKTPPPSSSEEISAPVIEDITIPYLVGKSYKEIMDTPELVNNFYFYTSEEFSPRPKGQIISQQPQADMVVPQGTIIYITLSKGEEEIKVQMPVGLKGRPVEEVTALLETMEIPYVTKEVPQTRQYSYGTVTGTDIPEGVMINPKETYVIVYVANNVPVVEIPQSNNQ